MIKLVAFDLDGTIADTVPMCIEAFREAVSPYAGHVLSDEEIIETFGLNEIGMVKSVVKERSEEALIDFYIKYQEMHDMCRKPFEGIIPLINMLKRNNIIVALVTGKGQVTCEITLNKFRMEEIFSDILTGSPLSNNKEKSLLALAEKYHLEREECLYIGDAVSDVMASNEAGIRCLSAAWGLRADIDGLSEINAGNVFFSIEEITNYLCGIVNDQCA